ncbi:flagellar hook-associated protein FlgK [Clostridium psychrophilum]|uniref:flagellar hook-associated protein FlgK n=1 Tax=Clostridium psychrophilum TaxID=132926 RepID=UPI001C0C07FD|nr:flagellar hook-associated protein FlgK [Clostridium psychrophilum]MBU3180667.1 flagellar hook-associated protein FlgK [Clostridium psychrophilum]
MSGLLSTLNVATRGLNAQQTAIDVTSHNIANANTEGYSRQRANMETTSPLSTSSGVGQIGTGVQVSSITRIRDSYLDYQVRTGNGTKGLYDGREQILSSIQSVFNEPSKTGISSLIGKVFDSWQTLSTSPELSNTRTVVVQQSKALTGQLNSTYNQLISLKSDINDDIKQDVVDVNSMLNQITDLNKQIKKVSASGDKPNDLMDKRDLLEDQLSAKLGIKIDKGSLGGDDIKATVNGATGDTTLVSATSSDDKRLSYISSIVPTSTTKAGEPGSYTVTYYKNADMTTDDNKVTMTMNLTSDDYTSLDQGRVLVADKDGYAIDNSGNRLAGTDSDGAQIVAGTTNTIMPTNGKDSTGASVINTQIFKPTTGELNGYMSVKPDIDTYVNQLNSLAKGIAFSVNAVLSGENDASATTSVPNFFVNSDATDTISADDAETGITAGNISVNKTIIDDVTSFKVGSDTTAGSTDGNIALAIAQLRDVKLNIQGIDSSTSRMDLLRTPDSNNSSTISLILNPSLGVKTITEAPNGMTIGGYFTNTINALAIQTQEATRTTTNQDAQLASLEKSRTSVSGVSLDEEMANLIQFQHAYQANAKIISTVDELLDVIINGLKK